MNRKDILKLALLLPLIFQLASCGDDQEKSARSLKTDLLTATPWGNAQVTHATDGDLSGQYTDFVITFTRNASSGYDGNFVVANGGHAFEEVAGKWKFDDSLNQLIFDSGKTMDIELMADHLQLDFTVLSMGGRADGLTGHFTFNLSPL